MLWEAVLITRRIKKAYRRKALELHPDRNINDTENATKRFAEVQTAYEVLSDPQERAWYDSHRDAILSGDSDAGGGPSEQSSAGTTSVTAIFSLMGRFSSSVPMNDSPSGFFGILNTFFEQLAAEEAAAAEWEDAEVIEYPPFGRATDDYDPVAKLFYRTWSSFSTRKSFSWRDKYRLSDAPDRYVRRLMEKENRKLREAGIREFNDAVQSLVAFVKKRDPRYVPNTQSEAERQQVLRNSAAQQAARSRAANQEKLADFTVPEWAQSRNDSNDIGEFLSSEEESEVEHIECVVCSKIFKSEKQYEVHEKSKKHVKAVQQLQRQMEKENATLALQLEEDPSSTYSPVDDRPDAASETPGVDPPQDHDDGFDHDNINSTTSTEDAKPSSASNSETGDDEYAPRSAVEERFATDKGRETRGVRATGNTDLDADIDSASVSAGDLAFNQDAPVGQKVGKAKLKREKKAARQAAEANAQESVSVHPVVSTILSYV